jgi:hypothetical protein
MKNELHIENRESSALIQENNRYKLPLEVKIIGYEVFNEETIKVIFFNSFFMRNTSTTSSAKITEIFQCL